MEIMSLRFLSFVAICVITSSNGRKFSRDKTNRKLLKADSDSQHFPTSSGSERLNDRIIKRSSGRSMVYIAKYLYDLTQTRPISVSVDSSMTKLIFIAEVNNSRPVIMGTDTLGLPTMSILNGSVSTIEGIISATDYGQKWTFTRLDRNIWDVTIMAESTIDFTYELIDVLTGTIWNVYPFEGREYKIVITVPNFAQLKMVALGMVFVKENPTAVAMIPLLNKGGGNYEFVYNMTDKNVMIGIDGLDYSNHHVRRMSPNLITPVNLILIVPPYTGVMLYESKLFTIHVTVINVATVEQDLDVEIRDEKNFAQAPVIFSPTIAPGKNWTGQFVIKGGLMGETTKVTITARPYLGHGQFGSGPSEVRQFTVYTNLTTSTATHSTSGNTISSTLVTNTLAAQPVSNTGTTQPLAVTATDGVSKYGQGATETSRSDHGFNIDVILTVVIVSGVSGGTLVGIAGLVIWGLLFRKVMRTVKLNSVQPEPMSDGVRKDGLRRKHFEDNFAWT